MPLVWSQPSFAVSEIEGTEARAREIGQFFLASSARAWNCSAVRPGTVPRVSRAIATIVQPMSCLSIVTVAVVLSSVGSLPALVIWNDRAIVKQLAWAAAISTLSGALK